MRDELIYQRCRGYSHRASTEGAHIEFVRVINGKVNLLQTLFSYEHVPEFIITYNFEDSQGK